MEQYFLRAVIINRGQNYDQALAFPHETSWGSSGLTLLEMGVLFSGSTMNAEH